MIWLFLVIINQINAHVPKGHERIEKEAFLLLKTQIASGNLPNGLEIYNFLVDNGVIKKSDYANSSYPDLDLGRQFLSDRQIFHFMADNRYVVDALRNFDDLETQKQYVLQKSLPDCLNMVYTLFREVVDNPEGANKAGRGIYVLMHAVMDSYSREHTIRDAKTYELESIKSWQLSRLYWPEGTKVLEPKIEGRAEAMVFLHTNSGLGDAEWEDKEGNLNPESKEAVKAVKDLLVAVYQAMLKKENEEKLIKEYISIYFKPKRAKVTKDYFKFKNEKISLSYLEGYANNYNVLKLDRYPLFSHMLFWQRGLGLENNSAFGYEFGYHITPRAAFSSTSFFQRLPYGFIFAINENTNILTDANFVESLQVKAVAKVLIYLPLRNLV